MTALSEQIALKILQDALLVLGKWFDIDLTYSSDLTEPTTVTAIDRAKELIQWPETSAPKHLQLVFDTVNLTHGQPEVHYWPAQAIANVQDSQNSEQDSPKIPYPTSTPVSEQLDVLKQEVQKTLQELSSKDWENFSLLFLILEKYGSYLSFGEADVAFFDRVRATAAVAASLGKAPDAANLCLVAGDLSGIQPFIYTISSDGALKSLRARSFYLELVAEEMTQRLLDRLELPRTNVIYTGGGKSFLLAPATEHTYQVVSQLRNIFNDWLLSKFQGKVFLNLGAHKFPAAAVSTKGFAKHWEALIQKLAVQKSRKFDNQIEKLLHQQDTHEPCKVCHRDDLRSEELKPLGGNGAEACPTCNEMFDLGQKLYRVETLVRTQEEKIENSVPLKKPIAFELGDQTIYYHLFKAEKPILSNDSKAVAKAIYLINNWDVSLYKFEHFKNPTLLLLGNYGQFVEAEDKNTKKTYKTFITAAGMTNCAQGIKRVGHLRMDVDRLGKIFANGLGEHYTLPRLAGLSRQMSYFFKVYLNSLAENRQQNFLNHQNTYGLKSLSKNDRKNLLFIYSGGDDLFVTGAWNELVEFAFDVYQSFRVYTGQHPDITLSGGVSLSGSKYPLYQSAQDSKDAEGAAKGNGRDSLSLFDQVFKWQTWLGTEGKTVSKIEAIAPTTQQYIGGDPTLALFGILPFVTQLKTVLKGTYPQSFVRNLLSTAQVQEQFIKRTIKQNKSDTEIAKEVRDIRYFLHLPKVAYTLARLPNQVKQADGFEAIRTSLKSPYNAPYFRAIATWIDLLNRSSKQDPDKP